MEIEIDQTINLDIRLVNDDDVWEFNFDAKIVPRQGELIVIRHDWNNIVSYKVIEVSHDIRKGSSSYDQDIHHITVTAQLVEEE